MEKIFLQYSINTSVILVRSIFFSGKKGKVDESSRTIEIQ